MTAPTLPIQIDAKGRAELEGLLSTLKEFGPALANLKNTGGGNSLGGLDKLNDQMKKLRTELSAGLQGIKDALPKGLSQVYSATAQAVHEGGQIVTKAITEENAAIQAQLTRVNTTAMAPKTAARYKTNFSLMAGTYKQEAAAAAAAISAAAKLAAEQEAAAARLEAAYQKSVVVVDRGVGAIMKAATQPGYKAAGPVWWESMLAKQDAANAKLQSAYQKSVATVDKGVASVMKAATQQGYKNAGPAWWESMLAAQDSANAKLQAAYAKSVAEVDKGVARVMKAVTREGYKNAGPAWWDKVIAEQDAATKKLVANTVKMDAAMQGGKRWAAAMQNEGTLRSMLGSGSASSMSQLQQMAAMYRAMEAPIKAITEPLQEVHKHTKNTGDEAGKAVPRLANFAATMRDAHGAARGLASGFGAIWTTYGPLVPLLAGAAVSNGFVQTIKMGAQVQNTFEVIRVLSEESYQSVGALNAQMLNLARTGPFGPLEVAEAMKTLSLAGLDAKEVGAAIKDVLNFAVAGDTSIKSAADVLSSVGAAFRVSSADYNYVGDVIAKTAAISKSSVESIGESFKTASVINSQFGASLEDVGVGLALLSNLGIKGSAAGTSLRNMYSDLFGRTPKVEAALKQLGVSAIDPLTGKARDLVTIFKEVNAQLQNFKPADQTKIMQTILSERGGKAGAAIMDSINMAAKEAGTTAQNLLDEIKAKVDNAAGFMAISAAQMALTPLNQMKSVSSTLQAALVETFSNLQPYITQVSMQLKEMFNSQEFRNGLARVVVAVADLTVWLVKHADVILSVVAAYTALKVALGVSTTLTALAATFGTLATATAAVGTATATALGTIGTMLTWMSRLVPVIGLAVAGWMAYSFWTGKAADGNKYTNTTTDALIASLKTEADRIEEVNEARRRGIDLTQVQAEKTLLLSTAELEGQVNTAKSAYDRAIQRRAEIDGMNKARGGVTPILQAQRLQEDVDKASAVLDAAKLNRSTKQLEIVKQEVRLRNAAVEQSKRVQADIKANALPPGKGDQEFKPLEKVTKDGANLDLSHANRVVAGYKAEEATMKAAASSQIEILKAKHDAMLIDEGEYQAKVMQITWAQEKQARDLISKRETEYNDALGAELDRIITKFGKGSTEHKAAITKVVEAQDVNLKQLQQESAELDAVIKKRRELAEISAAKEVKQLQTQQADYWNKDNEAVAKAGTANNNKRFYAHLPPEYLAQANARDNALSKYAADLVEIERKAQTARQAVQSFWEANGGFDGNWEGEAGERLNQLQGNANAYDSVIASAKNNAKRNADLTGKQAYDQVVTDRADQMRDSFADAVSTGLTEGGAAGGKALNNWLKNYFINQPIQLAIKGLMGGGMDGLMQGLGASAWGGLFSAFGFAKGDGFPGGTMGLPMNEIISSPHVFKFAKGGVGVAGEAGPEAIMPLARDGQGRLGVRTEGGGGSGGVTLVSSPTIHIDSRSDAAQIQQMVMSVMKRNNEQMMDHLQNSGVLR